MAFRGPWALLLKDVNFKNLFILKQFPQKYIPQYREKLNVEKYLKHIRRKYIRRPRPRRNGHLKFCAL